MVHISGSAGRIDHIGLWRIDHHFIWRRFEGLLNYRIFKTGCWLHLEQSFYPVHTGQIFPELPGQQESAETGLVRRRLHSGAIQEIYQIARDVVNLRLFIPVRKTIV